jgi:glycerate kinase
VRVVVAVDAFKGCLSSAEAGAAVRAGVLRADPGADVRVVPVADGGEGTVEALLAAGVGRGAAARVVDAIGRPVEAAYAVLDDGRTAVLEAASCVGLGQVDVDAHLPPLASSAGLGRLVRHAVEDGARRVVVALGGTACTDGGTGLLVALGARVRDSGGADVAASRGNPLWRFGTLDALPDLGDLELVVLTDVDSPLHGPEGAAHVFGPQKGATAEQVHHLDARLVSWGAALAAHGRPVAELPGAGAAGGLGAALLALGARREAGFEHVARAVGLRDEVAGADVVLTGEGRLDAQTARGKTPAGVAASAREAGAVVVALAGAVVRSGTSAEDDVPFDAVLPIHPYPMPLSVAMDPAVAAAGLAATAAQVIGLVRASRRLAPGGAAP